MATGKRAWVDGRDPIFPSNVADETEPGTDFKPTSYRLMLGGGRLRRGY